MERKEKKVAVIATALAILFFGAVIVFNVVSGTYGVAGLIVGLATVLVLLILGIVVALLYQPHTMGTMLRAAVHYNLFSLLFVVLYFSIPYIPLKWYYVVLIALVLYFIIYYVIGILQFVENDIRKRQGHNPVKFLFFYPLRSRFSLHARTKVPVKEFMRFSSASDERYGQVNLRFFTADSEGNMDGLTLPDTYLLLEADMPVPLERFQARMMRMCLSCGLAFIGYICDPQKQRLTSYIVLPPKKGERMRKKTERLLSRLRLSGPKVYFLSYTNFHEEILEQLLDIGNGHVYCNEPLNLSKVNAFNQYQLHVLKSHEKQDYFVYKYSFALEITDGATESEVTDVIIALARQGFFCERYYGVTNKDSVFSDAKNNFVFTSVASISADISQSVAYFFTAFTMYLNLKMFKPQHKAVAERSIEKLLSMVDTAEVSVSPFEEIHSISYSDMVSRSGIFLSCVSGLAEKTLKKTGDNLDFSKADALVAKFYDTVAGRKVVTGFNYSLQQREPVIILMDEWEGS